MKTQPKVHESSQAKLHMNHRMHSLHPKDTRYIFVIGLDYRAYFQSKICVLSPRNSFQMSIFYFVLLKTFSEMVIILAHYQHCSWTPVLQRLTIQFLSVFLFGHCHCISTEMILQKKYSCLKNQKGDFAACGEN